MIKIISFVDSFKHYQQPIDEFTKRLWKSVDFIKLKPSKRKTPDEIVAEETKILSEFLEKQKGYKVLLYIDSKYLSTGDFYDFVEKTQMDFGNLVFVIWWAYWVDYSKLQNKVDRKLSFSPMTFPHAQAIMMLLEQIYRVQCMKKGTAYHH